MVQSGEYSVTNCKSNTFPVVHLLDQLYDALQPVIADAKSPNPGPAFRAFFKDPVYGPFVTTILTNVTTGVPLTPPSLYSFNGGVSFVCVDDKHQFTFTLNGPRDAYTDCQAAPNRVSFYVVFDPPKPYIILCPSFFTTLAPVPPPDTCLSVSTYLNRFQGNGEALRKYQMWVLLSGILQYYIYASQRSLHASAAVDVNKCFRLAANRSILNAANYVFYVASIYGRCTSFPSSPDGREILEIDPGDLSDNGTDVTTSLLGVQQVASDLNLGGVDVIETP